MTTTTYHQRNEINAADAHRRQFRFMQPIFAGAAAIAMFALLDAARPDTTESVPASGSLRLVDQATDLPAPTSGPVGPQYPQTPPSLVGNGGFAADGDDDQAQEQAQQQEQLALQEVQQVEQQAEEQEQLANQEAQQAEQQGLQVEQQANQ